MTKPTDPPIGEAVERVAAAAAKRRAGARREAQDLGRRVGVDKYEAWTMETATTTVGSLDLEALLSENAQLRERVGVLEGIETRLAGNEELERLVYEIFYANPIAFARKNLVIGLQRFLRGEPLATPEEAQVKLLDGMSDEDRAAWHRANNAQKLNARQALDTTP